jgi:tetratricopeptide (TPR) repeat protein
MRYRLLETLRQYGAEQLREQGEEAEARRRHLAYFLRWTEAIEPELLGGQHADCYERLESEHDNLRAALAWCKAAPGGAEAGLRLIGVLWRFWDAGSYLTEGCQHLADILSLPEAAGGSREAPLLAARAKALHGAGVLSPRKYDAAVARQYLKESLAIWRELGEKQGIAEVLARLGGYMIIDDHEESRKLLQESLGNYQELGDQQGIASTLSSLGTLAWSQHDYAAARTLYEESRAISRRLGNRLQEQSILEMLGNISLEEGDLAAARSYLEEGLTIARAFGQKRSLAVGLYFLGHIAFQQGDHRTARVHWEESRRLDRENENRGGAVLGSLAELAAIEGDHEAARALWEQSLAEARELRSPERSAKALRGLAEVARRQRDGGKARSLYAQSLQIERELGNPPGIAECLEGLGRVAGAHGQPERVARLLGAVQALSQAGASRPHRKGQQVRAQDDPTVATARAALGEEAFAAAWAEGRAMTLDQAVAYALAAFPDA